METVAIIGAGRMGSFIARKLNSQYNIILIDKDLRKCGLLAKEISAIATDSYSLLALSDYVILALPADAIHQAISELKSVLQQQQVVINVSTNTEKIALDPLKKLSKIAAAKIMGHAQHMASTGELPLIVIDSEDITIRNRVAKIFSLLGTVCFGDEILVKNINNIASEEAIRAALNIMKRLEEINIPPEYISFAIRNVACGTMSAFALGEGGPFVQKLIQKINQQ